MRLIGYVRVTGVAAAIANAVFNATGFRARELPIAIEHLLAAGSRERRAFRRGGVCRRVWKRSSIRT
jgi:hypothetical protein